MIRHKNRLTGFIAAGLVLTFSIVPAAASQPMAGQENDAASASTATESTERQNKSLKELRKEYYSAEEKFYGRFNALNSSDDFDVDCKDEVPFGRGEKVHACKAAFLRKYEARLASKFSRRMSRIGEDALPSETEIDQKQEQLRKEISAAVDQNPDMQALYAELVRAKQDYVAKQQNP